MKKHFKIRYIGFGLFGIMISAALVFLHFGGFGTGENAAPKEFAAYAQSVDEIIIPENAKIIALGEATHGNKEFQQLKLTVFQQMVENYGVRAFALEGDYGGCEQVNRYIHGGEGTAEDAAAAIGFAIYRTEEMAALISYMRQYNETAAEGDDLRFYGFDMQRTSYSLQLLEEACRELDIDTTVQPETAAQIKQELIEKNASARAIHCADMLLQYGELQALTDPDAGALRDQLMAENVQWIFQQEEQRGCGRLFVSGHNGHVAKWGSFDSMGKLLSEKYENGYYVIGTDFYKTRRNLPTRSAKRTNQTFYSRDPLAKAAKLAGFDICLLDFANIPEDSKLGEAASQYTYMGSLGEGYSFLMRLLPPSYRIFQPPAVLYDSMIFVTEATPTKIIAE